MGLDEALELISRAIAINDSAATFHSNRGAVLFALGQHEDAIASYRHAIRWDPDDSNVHFNLGNVFSSQERWPEAVSAFQRAVELQPNFFEAHFQQAIANKSLKDPKLRLGTHLLEAPLPVTRSRASRKAVPKRSLGTR